MDIRKGNSLNVYYNGGSLLKITLSNVEISGKIREYYLGKTGSRYVEYDPNCLLDDANTIKARIALRNSDASENGIKAKLIFDPDAKYIDSEFAYPEIIGKKKDRNGKEIATHQTTRIDLTKLENGKIVFVELKRIEDSRLLTREYENGEPEILSQMESVSSI